MVSKYIFSDDAVVAIVNRNYCATMSSPVSSSAGLQSFWGSSFPNLSTEGSNVNKSK